MLLSGLRPVGERAETHAHRRHHERRAGELLSVRIRPVDADNAMGAGHFVVDRCEHLPVASFTI